MTADELWWKRVPAAVRLVKKTRDDLLSGRSVQLFSDMIWKEKFLEQVLSKVRNIDAGVVDIEFDGAGMDPTMSLIDIIAEMLGFGFNFDGTLKTLLGHLQINSRYVWRMRNLPLSRIKEAHQMIREFAKQNAFIAVILEDDSQTQVKSLHQIRLNPTRMDVQYFAWTLLMEREDVPLLEYAAILCEELSRGNLERCAFLCERVHELLRDAESVCDWLSAPEIQQAVHLAQLRGVQPIIEERRLKFIEGLGSRIERILPFKDEYGSQFTMPQEVELRHLIYYRYQLSFSQTEMAALQRLYDTRNDLSHLRLLSEDAINAVAALPGK